MIASVSWSCFRMTALTAFQTRTWASVILLWCLRDLFIFKLAICFYSCEMEVVNCWPYPFFHITSDSGIRSDSVYLYLLLLLCLFLKPLSPTKKIQKKKKKCEKLTAQPWGLHPDFNSREDATNWLCRCRAQGTQPPLTSSSTLEEASGLQWRPERGREIRGIMKNQKRHKRAASGD